MNWPVFIAGVALCLGGWMLYWVAMHLTGGIFGAVVGIGAAWIATILFRLEAFQIWIVTFSGALGFAIGIFLIRGLHRFAFFLIGSTAGLVAGYFFYNWGSTELDWIKDNPLVWEVILLVVPSIAGGILMVMASRWIVALVTSVAGTVLIFTSIPRTLPVIAIIPVVLAAFFLQAGLLGRLMPKKEREEEDEDMAEEERE